MKPMRTIFSFFQSSWEVQPWKPVPLHQGGVDVCNTYISICPGTDARDERQSDENDIVMENRIPLLILPTQLRSSDLRV